MYTRSDLINANRRAVRYAFVLAAIVLVALAAYVWAIIRASRGWMLTVLLAAFWLASLEIALCLRPALRYRRFLLELQNGLRRECICIVDSLDIASQMQDGARVRPLQVRLDDGDTRIFYLNADHAADFPKQNTRVALQSCGRHVVDWRMCE